MEWSFVSFGVIAFAIVMYVILDGFDLGVGILMPFAPSPSDRNTMISSVAPVWDGNETWLILGGATLLAGFPAAYSLLLPALYVPLMVFLFALVFRGVAFEFRATAKRTGGWTTAFSLGSTLAAFSQGIVLGSAVHGLSVKGFGGPAPWFNAFGIMAGMALICGYALLGATWTILKSKGDLQEWAYGQARGLVPVLLLFIVLVSIWTPLEQTAIARRWFSWPNLLFLSPVPLVTAWLGYSLWRALAERRELAPFLFSIGLFLLSFAGLAISLWPYIVPRELTIREAASPPGTQLFLLVGVMIMLPLVLGYTIHTYRVFRGKVTPGEDSYES